MVRNKASKPRRIAFESGNKTYFVLYKTFKEISKLQKSTKLCIPKLPFGRVVRETLYNRSELHSFKIQESAILALQEAAEVFCVQVFENANLCAAHAKRITVRANDIQLALTLRG